MNSSGPKSCTFTCTTTACVNRHHILGEILYENLNFHLNSVETCTVSAFPFNPRFFFFNKKSRLMPQGSNPRQHSQGKGWHKPAWTTTGKVLLSRPRHSYNNLLAGHHYHQKWWVASEKVQEKHWANSLSAAKKLHVKARKPVTCCYWTSNVRTSTWLWREALNTFLR